MQCKGRYGGVWICICPGMRGGGIVYRKYLYYLQTGFYSPVYQQFEIVELAGAERIFTAQAEHRHRHTGAFPVVVSQPHKTIVQYGELVFLCIAIQYTVGSALELYKGFCLYIINAILILERNRFLGKFHRNAPPSVFA